ncbi:MAG TPA: hypothetical protein DEH78_08975 [Solibacterales bacterium]|nr:hypothetical protein [Bryobacterales bacterium]
MSKQYWIEAGRGSVLTTAEVKAGVAAAEELAATLGTTLADADRDARAEMDRGNFNGPASALWCRLESRAVEVATAEWHTIPDDLSLVPG